MKRTERIPQGEYGIIYVTRFGGMHFLVHTQITSVHVLISEGGDHGMVERRIEIDHDFRICLDLDQV